MGKRFIAVKTYAATHPKTGKLLGECAIDRNDYYTTPVRVISEGDYQLIVKELNRLGREGSK